MKNCLHFFWIFLSLHCCNGYPIDPGAMVASSTVGLAALGLVFLVLSIVFLIGCACCRNNHGFKQFRDSTGSLNQLGFTNRLAAELSIFPPPGVSPTPDGSLDQRERFGPPATGASLLTRPAAFSLVAPDVSDWFGDPAGNYPRQNLFYQRELGKGWFGKVVEGEAKGVKVVVRILREDATPQEKAHFLHEARPFRDLRHRNVASLYGKCVDQDPYLLLFNLCNNGDLKSFLVTNSSSKAVLNEQGICLRMMTDIAEGLNYMIENNFIHTDLAARNCLVSSDLTVKIGDYGTGIDIYKDEYYITENVAIPIRWCAPETLHCTPTTIEAKQVTASANVWSLAVVLWEVAEFGRLPYDNLTDDQVIIRVFGSEQLRLPMPDIPYGQFLYNILQLCWRVNDRASMSQLLSMLHYMRSNPSQESEFDTRWKSSKPNSVPRVDNHTPVHSYSADIQAVKSAVAKASNNDNHTPLHSPRHTELALRPQLTVRSEFDSGVDLEMKATESSATPMTLSPQLSVTSDEFLQSKKSASLTNLQGSLEEVHHLDSWLEGVEQNTEEDRTFVKNVSQAIKSLDETLAGEEDEEASKPLVPSFRLGPLKSESSSSDTEEETWRTRIERGEFTEKVKEKSKSVTDLMVLTHIESEGSESDSLPSLTRQSGRKASLGKPAFTSIGFGSEGNIHSAVLSEDLQHKLKQLSLWKSPMASGEESQAFLAKVASETINSKTVNKHPFAFSHKKVKSKPVDASTENICLDKQTVNILHSESTPCNPDKIINEPISLPVYLDSVDNVNNDTSDVSSQIKVENIIPEITITETNMPDLYTEPHSEIDTNFIVNVKPRRTIFVYKEGDLIDEDDSSETASQNDGEMVVCDLAYDNIPLKEESPSETPSDTQNTSVILGSCEHYTLEYFKGLKTTFVPQDSSSDDGSFRFENTEDLDFVNDECQTNEDVKNDNQTLDEEKPSKICRHRDSMDDLLPDSLTASVTTISTSSGYATIEKDKFLKHDSSFLSDDHSFSPSRDSLLGKSDSLTWDKSSSDKQSTELFLTAEKEVNSLNFFDDNSMNMSCDSLEPPHEYVVNEVSAHDNFMNENFVCNSYFNESQHYDIKELKSRLEDAMKINNDYHLIKRSDDEGFGKAATPDDERSSDSGFRDKGSLSESAEDTCDEKYNIEDIDAELEEYGKGDNYDVGKDDWNGWLPGAMDYEPMEAVSVDANFLDALRNELRDKLPQVTQCHPDDDDEDEDDDCESDNSLGSSPEPESIEGAVQFNFPSRLSPILEERESNQSSLMLDDSSPLRLLDEVKLEEDEVHHRNYIVHTPEDRNGIDLDELEDGAQFTLHSGNFPVEEDVLVVDMETNEATLIESPKPLSHLAFSPFSQPIDRLTDDQNIINTDPTTYLPPRDSANLTPDISLSSPEQGNLSGFFLSPCSVRSDLFDSGPPSLPFDIGQSVDEIEDISPSHQYGDMKKSGSSLTLVEDDYLLKNSSDVSPALTLSASPKLQSDDLSPVTVKENLELLEDVAQPDYSDCSNLCSSPIDNLACDLESSCNVQSNVTVANESLSYDPIEKLVQETIEINKTNSNEDSFGDGLNISSVPESVTDNICSVKDMNAELKFSDKDGMMNEDALLPDLITSAVTDKNYCENDTKTVDHKKAESKIDLLITRESNDNHGIEKDDLSTSGSEPNMKNDLSKCIEIAEIDSNLDIKTHDESGGSDWLANLLSHTEEYKNHKLVSNGWPSTEELVVSKENSLSSTLALTSPSGEYPTLPLTPCSPIPSAFPPSSPTASPSLSQQNVDSIVSPDDSTSWRPTISQLLDMASEGNDNEEMTTSFIEPDETGSYTPDWESDTSESSSSGEFIWKDGDREDAIKPLIATPDVASALEPKMERIDEEDEDSSSGSESEGSCTSEFVPSTWDSSLTPCKPVLKQTQTDFNNSNGGSKTSSEKKKVMFKKEKYQCIYQYPREPPSDDEEDSSSSWHNPSSVFDYFDWELGEGEFSGPVEPEGEEDCSAVKKKDDFNFYQLNYNSNSFDDGDYFITGSIKSDCFSGIAEGDILDSPDEFSPKASDITPLKEPPSPTKLGVLRHTKDSLKLDLKPCQPDRGEATILDSGIDTC